MTEHAHHKRLLMRTKNYSSALRFWVDMNFWRMQFNSLSFPPEYLQWSRFWKWVAWPRHKENILYIALRKAYGLSRWLSGKEPACQCRRHGLNPWVGKIPWKRKGGPLQYSCLKKPHGQRSLVGYSLWVAKESDTALWLNNNNKENHLTTSHSIVLEHRKAF